MNDSPIKTVSIGPGKTINLQNFPIEAWHTVYGAEETTDLDDYYHKVSWAFRALDLLYSAVLGMPFTIYEGEKEIDSSKNYQNVVQFLPNPAITFGLIEMALTVWGKAYLNKRPNLLGTKTWGVRYMLPTSITINWAKDTNGDKTGEFTFTRKESKGQPMDLVYFWRPDPFVELGPPKSGPLMAAASAAGVLLNLDQFVNAYFQRGAIKTTLLFLDGNPPQAEKERIKSVWDRLGSGLKNAWGNFVLNAKSATPLIVGGDLSDLSDNDLTHQQREAIATALGIPHTKLFSSAASGLGGGGVAENDDLTFYHDKVVPDCRFIEYVLNTQLMPPYRIHFDDETLDVFQEDESQRASALSQFVTALNTDPEAAEIGFMAMGYEFTPDAQALLKKYITAKQERRDTMVNKLGSGTNDNQPPQPGQQPPQLAAANQVLQQPTDQQPTKRTDLDKWQTKATKALRAGKAAAVSFDSDQIPATLHAAISGALEGAQTVDDVIRIFGNVWVGYP